MGNIITVGILLLIVAFDIIYILKKKKSGKNCCGCENCSKCLKSVSDDSPCEAADRSETKCSEDCER